MANRIAFGEILSDKILHSLLDRVKHHVPVISCCILLAFMPICFAAFSRPRKGDHVHTRAVLQALLAVIVPRCSLWPNRYVKFSSVLRSRVDIPLDVIIEDTMHGIIEFRNPVNDLADLMDSGVVVNGYTIRIKTGWRWWISCFEWWVLAKVRTIHHLYDIQATQETLIGQPESDHPPLRSLGYMLELSDWLHTDMPSANACLPGLSLGRFAPTSPPSCAVFCLDHLPHGMVPFLSAGCKVTLEFTAFSPSLPVLSTAQIISALPFINSEHPRRWPRTVVSVLRQLSVSHGPNLAIDRLSNVSVAYEHTLRRVYKSFYGKQKSREMSMKILGVKAWRRDMFLVALEAALVRRGWVERWAVQVTVK